jgi:flagellar capping protein FliD
MTITNLGLGQTGTTTPNSLIATKSAKKADPISASLQKYGAKIQAQLDTTTTNLSTLGKFKASVVTIQTAANGLSALKVNTSGEDVKKALNSFVSSYNAMLASARSAAAGSGVDSISPGMTRAMTADFSRVNALRQMGFTKAGDGTLKLDMAKLDQALKASPSNVSATLNQLGRLVDKVATKELAGDGSIQDAFNTMSAKTSTLQVQQNALLKAAQQYASFAQGGA